MTAAEARKLAAAARARADKATPGPWESLAGSSYNAYPQIVQTADGERCLIVFDVSPGAPCEFPGRDEDAQFIASARTDVPKLCDAVDALAAEAEQLRTQRDFWRAHHDEISAHPYWKERDSLRAEVVRLKSENAVLRSDNDDHVQRAYKAEAKVARLREELRTVDARYGETIKRLQTQLTGVIETAATLLPAPIIVLQDRAALQPQAEQPKLFELCHECYNKIPPGHKGACSREPKDCGGALRECEGADAAPVSGPLAQQAPPREEPASPQSPRCPACNVGALCEAGGTQCGLCGFVPPQSSPAAQPGLYDPTSNWPIGLRFAGAEHRMTVEEARAIVQTLFGQIRLHVESGGATGHGAPAKGGV
jgi:uncharacterized membrane protein